MQVYLPQTAVNRELAEVPKGDVTPMNEEDQAIAANKELWERMVRQKCDFCVPWLDLDRATIEQCVSGALCPRIPERLGVIFPWDLLADVRGRAVLCLASGGGQQSAVFGLLGAIVTVVDLVEGQLVGDRLAAEHYGYALNTVMSDMRDLSSLRSGSFDLVWQGPSMCYVPDVREVYCEVARVLRPGGIYRADATDPGTAFADEHWDGTGYRITRPFSERRNHRDDGGVEFRHYLSDAINGLVEAGFTIQRAVEDPNHLHSWPDAEPGSWRHIMMYLPMILAIIAKRQTKTG